MVWGWMWVEFAGRKFGLKTASGLQKSRKLVLRCWQWGRAIQKVCELKEEKNFERKKAFPKRKEEE